MSTIISPFVPGSPSSLSEDFSYTIGHGVCRMIDFDENSAIILQHSNGFSTTLNLAWKPQTFVSLEDCNNIRRTLHIHREAANSVMRHSIQPAVTELDVEQLVANFQPEGVISGITNMQRNVVTKSLLEADTPRVLYCADSQGGQICSKAKMVLSTQGISLGFTAISQESVLVPSVANKKYFSTFLNETVSM